MTISEDKKQRVDNQRIDIIITFFVCATLISITALIGGFWGSEGFRFVGIGIGIFIMILMFFCVPKYETFP